MALQDETKAMSSYLKAFSDAAGKFSADSSLDLAAITADLGTAKTQKEFDDKKKAALKKYKEAGSAFDQVGDAAADVTQMYDRYVAAHETESASVNELTIQYISVEQEITKLNQRVEKYNKENYTTRLEPSPMPNRDALHQLFTALDTKKMALQSEKTEFDGATKKSLRPVKDRLKKESGELEKLKFTPPKSGKKKK